MYIFRICFSQFMLAAEATSDWTLLGFGILLLILLMILVQGKPRGTPTIVQTRTPQQWTDDPKFAAARRKAVAAAYAHHAHHVHQENKS